MTRNARRRLILERHRSASCWRNKDIAKPAKKRSEPKAQPEVLKGWQQIAGFLGHPSAVVQRWASEGMPVHKQGRYVETTPEELKAWLGKQAGKPLHVATESTDLTAELKRGLSFVQGGKRPKAKRR